MPENDKDEERPTLLKEDTVLHCSEIQAHGKVLLCCPVLWRWAQHSLWLACPCPLATLQQRIFFSSTLFGPSSSFWLALSKHLRSHWAQHGVMFSFPHCYSVISVISESIRGHSGLAEHAHNVSELMLDPLSYFHPIWSRTISLTLWITPKPQTVRTTSITAAMGPVPPAASAAFQRLTRTN